jgi:hypothetical protein
VDNNPQLQNLVPQIKALLERIAQAKNNPGEVQKAVDEGKKQLEQIKPQGQDEPQPR